jgi:hypothetical protein
MGFVAKIRPVEQSGAVVHPLDANLFTDNAIRDSVRAND